MPSVICSGKDTQMNVTVLIGERTAQANGNVTISQALESKLNVIAASHRMAAGSGIFLRDKLQSALS